MKYNGFYFALFRGTMKKVLTEYCGQNFARDTMKKAYNLYKKLVLEADDIGAGNPMAYNELFALAFVTPYIAIGWGDDRASERYPASPSDHGAYCNYFITGDRERWKQEN